MLVVPFFRIHPPCRLLSDKGAACCAAVAAPSFGTPTPTQVSLDPVEGKCILITGHDMHDLHELLKQTEGKVRGSFSSFQMC
jgi:hydroxylamine reductase (hybrid-cluster protein)